MKLLRHVGIAVLNTRIYGLLCRIHTWIIIHYYMRRCFYCFPVLATSGCNIYIYIYIYLFVDLGIQHAMRMCRIMLSSVTCLPLQYFSRLFYKRKDLRERVIEHKMFVVMLSTTLVWNISHSKENSATYHNKCTWVFIQSTRYFWQILIKLDFLADSRKNFFNGNQMCNSLDDLLVVLNGVPEDGR